MSKDFILLMYLILEESAINSNSSDMSKIGDAVVWNWCLLAGVLASVLRILTKSKNRTVFIYFANWLIRWWRMKKKREIYLKRFVT